MSEHADNDGTQLPALTYSIGELAREFSISARAIRLYEDQRLLAPIRVGQKRHFRPRDRARLKLIMRGKRLGFTLAEIRETFELYDQAHGKQKQLRYYLGVLDRKRAQLRQQYRDIQEALEELEESYRHCETLLSAQEAREETRNQARLGQEQQA